MVVWAQDSVGGCFCIRRLMLTLRRARSRSPKSMGLQLALWILLPAAHQPTIWPSQPRAKRERGMGNDDKHDDPNQSLGTPRGRPVSPAGRIRIAPLSCYRPHKSCQNLTTIPPTRGILRSPSQASRFRPPDPEKDGTRLRVFARRFRVIPFEVTGSGLRRIVMGAQPRPSWPFGPVGPFAAARPCSKDLRFRGES